MAKLCLFCMEEYKNDEIMSPYKTSDNGLYQDCPKRACDGKIYNIDDNLISTVMILNSKGFPTYSSCAGHQLEVGTETYIEFSEEVKSLPVLPEGFKLRMRTIGGKTRLLIYRRPLSVDPVSEHAELLDFAEILYEWAMDLDFNFDHSDIVFIDMNSDNPFASFFSAFYGDADEDDEDEKPKDKKRKLNVDKLKESAPKASIKLKRTEAESPSSEEAPGLKEQEPAKEDKKTDKPKTKRGRPKKNQD